MVPGSVALLCQQVQCKCEGGIAQYTQPLRKRMLPSPWGDGGDRRLAVCPAHPKPGTAGEPHRVRTQPRRRMRRFGEGIGAFWTNSVVGKLNTGSSMGL